MGKLKPYAVTLCVGAAAGVTIAETWRRKVHHDSYLNYLPPPVRDGETAIADEARSGGRLRGAADRLWLPVAASAKKDWMRTRRVRAGAPRPRAGDAPPAEVPPDAAPPATAS
jgi:hypothetical protein